MTAGEIKDGNATINSDGKISTEKIVVADLVAYRSVELGATTINGTARVNGVIRTYMVTGMINGDISETSTDAVNGRQCYIVQENVNRAQTTADCAMQKADEAYVAIGDEVTNRINADKMLDSRIDSVSSRVDKVGACAAALAALHPLDYDTDNKLSFASGVGNYAGSTAMAIGAFYRPNETCMMSFGGSMGGGENMVNLGVSFAIDKGQSPYASMSKKDLVHKIEQKEHKCESVEAENQAMRDELESLKAVVAELATRK